MKFSCNDFVGAMEKEFYDATGQSSDCASDLSLRFKMLATQLFSISSFGEFVLKQAFVQTAQGEYLDMHAQMNGMDRKKDSKAQGLVRFSVDTPATVPIEIPMGTVIACSGKNYLRYVTDETMSIRVGKTEILVSAVAMDAGEQYNTTSGEINIMVTPPAGVSSVVSTTDFVGGCSDESDASLRARLLSELRHLPNGSNRQSFIHRAMTFDEVIDANAFAREQGGKKSIVLALRTRSGEIDSALKTKLQMSFYEANIIPFSLIFEVAVEKRVDVQAVIFVESGYTKATVLDAVRDKICENIEELKINEPLSMVRLGQEVGSISGVRDFTFKAPQGIIGVNENGYIRAGTLEVTADEW